MKTAGWFKRVAASVCVAALLATGVTAFAASPAEAVSAAELSMTNAYTVGQVYDMIDQIGTVTRARRPQIVAALDAYNSLSDADKAQVSNFSVLAEAQQILGIQDALAKLTVKHDKVDDDWQLSTPYEDNATEQKVCSVYPWLYIPEGAGTVHINAMFQYIGDERLDLYQIIVRSGSKKYTFNCDTDYDGGYDPKMQKWFDLAAYTMDDAVDWFTQWLSQDEVVIRFTGWEGNSLDYTLTPQNRQGITDILNAYALLNAASPDVRLKALRNEYQ